MPALIPKPLRDLFARIRQVGLTKELVAQVLAAKVTSGLISRRAARTIARRFLHDNAVNLFGRADEQARLKHELATGFPI